MLEELLLLYYLYQTQINEVDECNEVDEVNEVELNIQFTDEEV